MIARAINQPAQQQPAQQPESRAAQWRRRRVLVDLPLPSGLTATLTTPDLIGLQRDGVLPEAARDPVARYLLDIKAFKERGTAGMVDPNPLTQLIATAEMYAVIDAVVVAACIDPRVSFTPASADVLHTSEIDIMDKMAIWEWATGLEQGTIGQVMAAARPPE